MGAFSYELALVAGLGKVGAASAPPKFVGVIVAAIQAARWAPNWFASVVHASRRGSLAVLSQPVCQ